MTPDQNQTFNNVFRARGLALDDYRIDVMVFSEANILIVVCDRQGRHLNIPVEDNVLEWPKEKLAELVVAEIEEADKEIYDG